jgi:hypothetical protein
VTEDSSPGTSEVPGEISVRIAGKFRRSETDETDEPPDIGEHGGSLRLKAELPITGVSRGP